MKTALKFTACVIAVSMLVGCQSAPKVAGPVQITDMDGVDNLYAAGPVYVASQPSASALQGFADEGVTVVVNFRTDGEMDGLGFDEAELCADAGLEYVRIPIGGANKYTPEALAEFAEVMDSHDGKALLHCRSGGRVTNFYVAYLVKYRGYDINEAYEVGLDLRYRSHPLELLLDQKIEYRLVD